MVEELIIRSFEMSFCTIRFIYKEEIKCSRILLQWYMVAAEALLRN